MATGPTKDVKEFQFKISGQLKVFPSGAKLDIENPVKLVATSSKYGIAFVGTPSGVTSIITKSILYNPEIQSKSLSITSDFPQRLLPLPSQPSHVDVSADNELLAVAIRIQDIPVLQIYSVPSFASMTVVKKVEMRMSNTGGVKVSDLQWNPGVANVITAVMNDGSVVLYEIKDSAFTLNSLPPSTKARCLCWSPKGKQVVIGFADGSLSQFKPDLKPVKSFPPPFQPASVVSVHWPSSFQFIAAYSNTLTPNDRPDIVIVNVPKGGQISYIRYEDVCFGSLSKRPEYYFIHQQVWNVIVLGCGDSMELSVLGLEGNTVNWAHWKQEDSARAELPLTQDKDDVHNLGIALDTSPSQPIQINDSLMIGPMPLVLSLSHDGVLVLFTAMNFIPGSPSICSPPQPFPDQSGLSLFTVTPAQSVVQKGPQVQPVMPSVASSQPSTQITPAFSQSGSMFPFTPPTQAVSPFSQTTSSFPTMSLGGQPAFSSAFAASTQPSLLPSSSPFSQATSILAKGTPPLFSSLTPAVSQAAVPASTQPPTLPVTSTQPLATSNSLLLGSLTTPSLTTTVKPVLPTTTSAPPSFGLMQQPSLTPSALSKPSEPTPTAKTTFSLGGFGLDSSQLSVKSEPPKTMIKPTTETPIPVKSVPPIAEVKPAEEKVDTTEIDNAAYMAAIYDELKLFQDEFKDVSTFFKNFKIEIAPDKAKGELCSKIDDYEEFSNELVETTQAQCAEVSSLRTSILEVLSCIQLIKTKISISKNPSLMEMREAEEMDPISKHWCKQIEQRLYNLQSQIKQAVEQIESIKNADKGCGLKISTFDTILQTLVNLTKVCNFQKAVVTSIEEQLSLKVKLFEHRKKKILQADRPSRNKIEDDSHLSKLAQKLLQTKLEATEDVDFSYKDCSLKMIARAATHNSTLDPTKQCFIQDWLKKHKIIHTKMKHPPSVSELNSSQKPLVKSSDKTPVKNLENKITTPDVSIIQPLSSSSKTVPTTKSSQLNRNLFSAPSDNFGVSGLSLDAGVTSTPLPAKKDQILFGGVSPVQAMSVQVTSASSATISSPLLATPKSNVLPFGSVVSSPQISSSTSAKTSTTKPLEIQPKPSDQGSKAIEQLGSSQPNIFSFSNLNKENSSSLEIAPSNTPSLVPKGVANTSIFVGITQNPDKKSSSGDTSAISTFNFGSLASSLKSSPLDLEKAPATAVVEPLSSLNTTKAFNLGSLSFGSSLTAPNTSLAPNLPSTTSTPSMFSFNRSSGSPAVTSTVQTTTVSSGIKPLSTFSFNSVTNADKPSLTISSTAPVQPVSSFSFSSPPSSESSAPISFALSPSVLPVSTQATSITPIAGTTALSVTQPSSGITSTSSAVVGLVSSVGSGITVASTVAPTNISSVAPTNIMSSVPPTNILSAVAPTNTVSTVALATVPSTVITTTSASTAVSSSTATTTTSTSASIFSTPQIAGESPSFKPSTTSTSAFGAAGFGSFAASTASAPLFGSAAAKFSTAATTASSVFGGLAITTTSSAPVFSQAAATTATTTSFGQSVTSTQAPASPFSQTAVSQAAAPSSPFSQPETSTSAFGTPAFGSTLVFSSLSSPSFGGAPTFGTPTTTQSVFGSNAAATTTASSLFSTPLFGQTAAGNASPFGSVTAQASPFSPSTPSTQATTFPFGTTPPANPFFNQSQTSVFGQAASQGNFGSSGGSMFGGSSSFGSSAQGGQFQTQGSSIFGGGGAGGGPFSCGGTPTVGQAGFGASQSFQSPKPTGAFGSQPVFGSTPSFGGAPAFGSSASFGSPNKSFGSTSPIAQATPVATGFGGQGNMFESLASSQNVMSFGNLAQSQQAPTMTPSFGSPQQVQPTTPSFGGNAFSSWR